MLIDDFLFLSFLILINPIKKFVKPQKNCFRYKNEDKAVF